MFKENVVEKMEKFEGWFQITAEDGYMMYFGNAINKDNENVIVGFDNFSTKPVVMTTEKQDILTIEKLTKLYEAESLHTEVYEKSLFVTYNSKMSEDNYCLVDNLKPYFHKEELEKIYEVYADIFEDGEFNNSEESFKVEQDGVWTLITDIENDTTYKVMNVNYTSPYPEQDILTVFYKENDDTLYQFTENLYKDITRNIGLMVLDMSEEDYHTEVTEDVLNSFSEEHKALFR